MRRFRHVPGQSHPRRGPAPGRADRNRRVRGRDRPVRAYGHRTGDEVRVHHKHRLHRPGARRDPCRSDRRPRRPRRAGRRRPRPVGLHRRPAAADAGGRTPCPDHHRGLHVQPQRGGAAPVRRPGRPVHLPLHPVRGRGRPADVRLLRAARSEGPLHPQRDRPGRLDRGGQHVGCGGRRRRSRSTPDPVRRDAAHLDLPDRPGRRGLRPGGRSADGHRGSAVGAVLPAVGRRAPGRRGDPGHHRRRVRRVREALRDHLPVRQVRPGLRARVQRRRDGERGLRDPAGRVPVPQQGHGRVAGLPQEHDPARAVPHVVRRPGDHAVVGRPVAEGVVRHLVGELRGQRAGRGPGAVLGRVREQLEDLGLPAGPAALHPPGGCRYRRPRRRRAELRHDHVRKGRVPGRPAGRLRRPRGLPGRGAGLLRDPRVRQHRAGRPAGQPAADVRAGPVPLVRAVAGDGRRQHPPARSAQRPGRDHHRGRGNPDGPGTAPDPARAPGRPRALRRGERPAGPPGPDRAGRRRAANAGARPGRPGPTGGRRGQRRRPDLRQDSGWTRPPSPRSSAACPP